MSFVTPNALFLCEKCLRTIMEGFWNPTLLFQMLDYLELNHDWICKRSVWNILCYAKYQVGMFTYCFWNLLNCRTYNVMCKHSGIFEFIALFILKMPLPINYVNLSFIGKIGPSFKTTLPLGNPVFPLNDKFIKVGGNDALSSTSCYLT